MNPSFQSLLLTGIYHPSTTTTAAADNSFTFPPLLPLSDEDSSHLHHPSDYYLTLNQTDINNIINNNNNIINSNNNIIMNRLMNDFTHFTKPRCLHNLMPIKPEPQPDPVPDPDTSFFFSHLPDLQSLEEQEVTRLKRKFSSPLLSSSGGGGGLQLQSQTLGTDNYLAGNNDYFVSGGMMTSAREGGMRSAKGEKEMKRRRTISEKTMELQRMLPVDDMKKMDTATVYEQAFDYIKYLEAQIKVLETMPVYCSKSGSNFTSGSENGSGRIGGGNGSGYRNGSGRIGNGSGNGNGNGYGNGSGWIENGSGSGSGRNGGCGGGGDGYGNGLLGRLKSGSNFKSGSGNEFGSGNGSGRIDGGGGDGYGNGLLGRLKSGSNLKFGSGSGSGNGYGSGNGNGSGRIGGNGYGYANGLLGRLNRQQVLEVLLNSPEIQGMLYSKGCCVYSVEQMMVFNQIAEKSFMLSDY